MVAGPALQVTQTPGNEPARSWVLRTTIDGRRRAMGLGSYPAVTLAEAWKQAKDFWRDTRDRRDPLLERRQEVMRKATAAAASLTFEKAATQYIEERRPSWKNLKHAAHWEAILRTYANPVIGAVPVADVDRAMVLKIVKPIWNEKTETAKRVKAGSSWC